MMNAKEIAEEILTAPTVGPIVLASEFKTLARAHLDLLAKQAGMVLVSVKDLEELVDSWNGGDVKSASMYEAVKYFEGLIVEAK